MLQYSLFTCLFMSISINLSHLFENLKIIGA